MTADYSDWLVDRAERHSGISRDRAIKLLEEEGCTEDILRYLIVYSTHSGGKGKLKDMRRGVREQRRLLKRMNEKDLQIAQALAKAQYENGGNDTSMILTGLEQQRRDGLISNWGLHFQGTKVSVWKKDNEENVGSL